MILPARKVTVQKNNNRDKRRRGERSPLLGLVDRGREARRGERRDSPVFCEPEISHTRLRAASQGKLLRRGRKSPAQGNIYRLSLALALSLSSYRPILHALAVARGGETWVGTRSPLMFVPQRSIMHLIGLELLCERSIDHCLTSETTTILTYPFVLRA